MYVVFISQYNTKRNNKTPLINLKKLREASHIPGIVSTASCVRIYAGGQLIILMYILKPTIIQTVFLIKFFMHVENNALNDL